MPSEFSPKTAITFSNACLTRFTLAIKFCRYNAYKYVRSNIFFVFISNESMYIRYVLVLRLHKKKKIQKEEEEQTTDEKAFSVEK